MSAWRAAWRAARMAQLAAVAVVRGGAASSATARAARQQQIFAELLRAHGVAIELRGALPTAPAVLVANHQTYLDPIVVGALAPLAPVAKAEVAPWPLIGAAAARLGAVFVDRACALHGAMALRRGLGLLRSGVSVLVFPEGTTSRDGVLPFHLGAFGMAVLARVPVVPIALRYDTAELSWCGGETFLPHYLRTAARRASAVGVRVGAALWPQPQVARAHAAGTRRRMAEELAGTARRSLCSLLEERHDATVGIAVSTPRVDPVLSLAGAAAGRPRRVER